MSAPPYRTAIVTGASRGIGAATVRRLRQLGLEVHAIARSTAPLDALARETGCRPLALDIADREAVQAALGALCIDVLINNASPLVRSAPSWVPECSRKAWRKAALKTRRCGAAWCGRTG